jgi:predicted RNase H-like nuclease
VRFISLDLAWSARNLTGAAVVEGDDSRGRLVGTGLLRRDEDVVEFVLAHVGKEPAIIAIDAPLVVPNEAGRRPAEAEIGSVFARYRASAHSASRKRLGPNGTVRGEELVDRLEDKGFVHRAEVEAPTPVRQAIEVYPHPAIISIFDLDQIIKHKAR